MNLRNHKDWDRVNGLLSVSMNPHINQDDGALYVLLNGSTGNFCLDYSSEDFKKELAIQRAWSSDTGYYVKILTDETVKVIRWWDNYEEILPAKKIKDNPTKFYQAITKQDQRAGSIIAFAKGTFVKLRNCIQQSDNGQASLRTFMYLLAALKDNVETPKDVNKKKWHLKDFDSTWITEYDWEWIYHAFKKGGANNNSFLIAPLVELVLRHASNRLFQEAHRESTRKVFQTSMFGGTSRNYDSGISDGAFYTPTPLVRTIVQEALWSLENVKPLSERPELKILDPACGSAEFLREILRQLKMKDYSGTVTIDGWDISEIACEMATFVLHYENQSEWAGKVTINVEQKDSLTTDWPLEQYDIVLMNPPFLAFEKLGTRKDLVQEKLSGFIKQQPDAAALFWKNASEIVKENGVVGVILPHSLLGTETYGKLRKYLKEDLLMDFSLIGRLGSSGLFEKAMIIPSILVGTKMAHSKANTVLWSDFQQTSAYEALRELRKYRLADIATPIVTNSYSIYENELLTNTAYSENWSVNSYNINKLGYELRSFNRVGKLFNITRGADAGNNAAFLLNRGNWLELPKKERLYFRPCIMRDSIQSGKLNDNFYLFYPYGKYSIVSEEELKQKLPVYYANKLIINKINLQKRRGKLIKWWELNEHRPWQQEMKPKLVSTYFGKAGYFAFDQKGEFLVGQSFAWLPKKGKELLSEENYCFAYLALLHAPFIDMLLEMVCNVLDGGYYDLSKHYVEKMPLPDLTVADVNALTYLSQIGQQIHMGIPVNKGDLNQIVANLYGINLELLKSISDG